MLELFESFDIKLAKVVRAGFRTGMDITSSNFKDLLSSIKEIRTEMMGRAGKQIRKVLRGIGRAEHEREWELLAEALGLTGKRPKPPKTSDALKEPFSSGASSASTLGMWLAALKAVDFDRIRNSLLLATSQEESTDLAVARVVGTKSQSFRDGVAANTRNNIRALVATSIAHVAQFFRARLWADVPQIAGMMWVAILDNRTTAVCRARDNKVVMFGDNDPPDGVSLLVPQGARPPAHPNCRSRMVAFTKGAIPIRTTFDEFLREQSQANQNQILGKAKAEMYRNGDFTLDDFVDDVGEELTLQQLKSA